MTELKELKEQLWSLLQNYSHSLRRATRFVKVALIIGGALVASIGLSVDLAHANHEISAWTIAGLAGAALIAIGGVFDAFLESNAAAALLNADRAIEACRDRELELREMVQENGRFDTAVVRGIELYNSMDAMRGAIEQSLSLSDVSLHTIIQTCLSAPGDSLLAAFGFDVKDIWTVCIYIAQPSRESGKQELRCVAQTRKIACDLNEARVWPEGVGVTGIAYSTRREIIVQDISSPEISGIFDGGPIRRNHDKERFSSMVACPIVIGAEPRPWGVAVVTTDKTNHFSPEPSYGMAHAEPIRAVAAMVALAVKAEGLRRRPSPIALQPDMNDTTAEHQSK